MLTGVLAAVDWMFFTNYLHRDIKPENILVSESGEGILADFGLVVRVEEATQAVNIGAGTEDYSAKEVFTTGSVLPSDLFSVGVCFVEMMIGRCPFNGEVGGSVWRVGMLVAGFWASSARSSFAVDGFRVVS